MFLNQNTATSFYGQRPPLSQALPSQGVGHTAGGFLAGFGTQAAEIYIPGSIGSKVIGGTIDKLADQLGQIIMTFFPALGTVLYFVTDALAWASKPVAKYLSALVEGVVLYCPEVAANKVLDYIDKNKNSLIADAFKDCMFAFYRRVVSTGGQATDIKQGRDKVLGVLMQGVLEALGVGMTGNRVANTLYQQAIAAGAADWQAGAAVGYGVVAGLPSEGLPASFKVKVPYTGTEFQIAAGAEVGKAILSVPDVALIYLSKLGTPPTLTTQWIAEAFKNKSGVDRSGAGSASSGGAAAAAVPLLAVAALAYFASQK